jgi:hypothetical protein
MDLNCPHYHIDKSIRTNYLKELQEFVDEAYNSRDRIKVYKNSIREHRCNFLTVINDMTLYPCLQELSLHYNQEQVSEIVNRYKENGKDKDDAGRGNIYFDRGKCSAANQHHNKEYFGLAAPADKVVDSLMSQEHKDFCEKTEKLIYCCMKVAMPLARGHEDHLYLIPPRNKFFLQKQSLPIHAARYLENNPAHGTNIHCDMQNRK